MAPDATNSLTKQIAEVKWEWLAQVLAGELAELNLKQDYACNCCLLCDGQHQVECPVPYLLQLHVERPCP